MGQNTMTTYHKQNLFIKFKQDLVRDITLTNINTDQDSPIDHPVNLVEVSECNLNALKKVFLPRIDSIDVILEIGVNRIIRDGGGTEEGKSFSALMTRSKKKSAKYFGIDVIDKTYMNDLENNVYLIHNDSSNYSTNLSFLKSHGVKKIDFLFIDGWHSINQVIRDWEYTNLLSDHGVVAFHDTNYHPGPKQFCSALNREKWNVDYHCLGDDWGIAFATKKL